MEIKNILYPTDFSSSSKSSRDYTIYLSKVLNSTVYILHAIEPLQSFEIDDEIEAFYDELRNVAESKIEKEKIIFNENNINVITEVILGIRWKSINDFAKINYA